MKRRNSFGRGVWSNIKCNTYSSYAKIFGTQINQTSRNLLDEKTKNSRDKYGFKQSSVQDLKTVISTVISTQFFSFHFSFLILFCCCLVAKSCPTLLQPHELQPTRLFCSWNFPGKNTGVGYHFLLQGIFLTQESNLCLLHCRWFLYP